MTLAIVVAYAAPGTEAIVRVSVANGATVADAVAASGLRERLALPDGIAYAIHGQAATAGTPLADGDRVELTRPLVADAKAVRRAHAAGNPRPRTHKIKPRQP
ncbi:MAG: RnfH family protein [Burkholderiales bacterium]|nr:RnfH family protein [Burkholderiales bacterium]